MNKSGKIAISEILLLLIGIIAFAYIAGIGSLGLVSAVKCGSPGDSPCPTGQECKDGECKGTVQGGVGTVMGGATAILPSLAGRGARAGLVGTLGTASGQISVDSLFTGHTYRPGDSLKFTTPGKGTEIWTLGKDNEWHIIKNGQELSENNNGIMNYYRDNNGVKVEVNPSTASSYSAGQGWLAVGKGVLWGIGAGLAVRYFAPMFGASEKQAQVLGWAAFAGVSVGKSLHNLGVAGYSNSWAFTPTGAFVIGAAVTAVIVLLFYEREATRKVNYNCELWDAPVGGQHCEECNELKDFPCSEYQCRSLGQGCQLLNKGTKQERCAWNNSKDVIAPVINTWLMPLTTGYRYSPDNATNPPDRGVRIIAPTSDECVPAFTPLVFGIQTDEPAKCKVDTLRKNFSEMTYFFGGSSLFAYNHTQTMAMPGVKNVEQEGANITLENDGEVSLYVRCQDANGNSNAADLVFKFCAAKGPDNTAPVVVDTSIVNNMPVAVGQDEVDLDVYLNEPSECKWSTMDKDYEQMENTMDCSKADSLTDAIEINSRLVYTCETTLTGIKDKFENKFYFRCKDQPKLSANGTRNTNAESYLFTIFGTETLAIDKAGPNETVRDSTEAVKVTLTAETSGGFKEGEAICYFRDKDSDEQDYVQFFATASYTHSTDLYLAEEDYQYIIRCVDLGGNSDTWQVNFSVESDSEAPIVARAYKEENYLKITTDENATCVYDTASCSYLFEDGLPMTAGTEKTNHFVTWSTKNKFYIKCKDDYGNQPPTDQCSIIARPI